MLYCCKSIGQVVTDKIYLVLFDSGSSKTLIHKQVVPCNYQPIHSDDDSHIFSLARTFTPTNLVALHKIRFPEFNCIMVVNVHPALIVDSTSQSYVIIFGADFLNKCGFQLNHDNNLFNGWNTIFPSMTQLNFCIQLLFFLIHTNWYWPCRQLSLQCLHWLFCNVHPWCQIHFCLQPAPSLTRSAVRPFQCLIYTQKYLMAPLESTLTKRFTLTSNPELS